MTRPHVWVVEERTYYDKWEPSMTTGWTRAEAKSRWPYQWHTRWGSKGNVRVAKYVPAVKARRKP